MKKFIAIIFFITTVSSSWAQTAKDYFQPLVPEVKYRFEALPTKSQKVLADIDKKSHLRSFREMEFLSNENLSDGSVKASFKHLEYSTSDSGPMTLVDNTLTYLLYDDSIKNITDMGEGKIYEEGFDVKMPQQDHPVTWVNAFHGDLSNIGGDEYEIKKPNKAYFGKCKTPYGVFPDCIVVEEIDPGSDRDTLTRIYYAKSVGRVKDEYFNMDKKEMSVKNAKIFYGKSWKSELNKYNKSLMKWVDNGTSELIKIEKISDETGAEKSHLPSDSSGKLTEADSRELNKFTRRDALINPLIKTYGNPSKFDGDTLYVMKNFKIVQKIEGGYLITPNMTADQVTAMEFNMAFLKTEKQLSPDLLISGAVYYTGDFKYTGIDGFEHDVPLLKIPAHLPLLGIHPDVDPFKQEEY